MRQVANNYSGRQKLTVVALFAIFVVMVVSLSRSLIDLLKVDERVISLEQEVAELEGKNKQLEILAQEVDSGKEEERQIREKLGLVKPGEVVVVVPEQLMVTSESDGTIEVVSEVKEEMEIWRAWLSLFL